MRTSAYKKVDRERWGWMATMPFHRKLTAEMYAEQLEKQYEDVRVEENENGDFVVKYRGPRGK